MVESQIPMRRAGDVEEMAAVIAFLCSDEAAYITGQTVVVDGAHPLPAIRHHLVIRVTRRTPSPDDGAHTAFTVG